MTKIAHQFIKALTKLEELRKLPNGWDYGRDGPPTEYALRSGRALLGSLGFLHPTDIEVLPGSLNGISIIATKASYVAEIHINSDGSFNLVHEHNGEEIADHQRLSLNSLICLLEEQGWRTARLFVSCIRGDSASGWGAIQVRHSGPDQMHACPSSVVDAWMPVRQAYARTLKNTTISASPDRLQSSGEYLAVPFRQEYA